MVKFSSLSHLPAQRRWPGLLITFAAGALLMLALPPLNVWPLMFLSLGTVLMLFEASAPRYRDQALKGFAFGFGYFVAAFHWIGFAFLVDASTYLWMMPFAVGGLAAFMALYWALAFSLAHAAARRGIPAIASLPLFLALVEILRGILFTGFPWAAPGLIADGMGGTLQLASLVGMPGLTYLILLWGMLPGFLMLRRGQGARRLAVPLLLLFSLPVAWLWGDWRLAALPREVVANVQLLLVQPNVSQDDKWRSDNAPAMFEDLIALSTQKTLQPKPTLIIWPESAVPFLLDESEGGLAMLATALEPGQTLLTGAIRREFPSPDCKGCPERYFTSILEIDEKGIVDERYDKWRLVPGGEYLPLAWLMEPLGFRKVVSLPESFSAGPGPASVDLGAAGRAGLLICYEAVFPDKLVDAGNRPDWLINVTNDGWFGHSVGPYQHLAQVRMRAVEQNMPVARAANTGISAIIDGGGRVLEQSTLGTRAAVSGALPAPGAKTIFGQLGIWLSLVVALVLAALLAFSISSPMASLANNQKR